ncbi:four helix bundle suffix domain-containing protein [Desulfobacter postgatei]|uniref:four helix bundle suffix domain-containing protein n=1 Tax=Desulfobacter postgatei TaxID=2293 RepID=UPI000311FB9F
MDEVDPVDLVHPHLPRNFRQRHAGFNRRGLLSPDRQVERLAKDFENQGGFTERLYRVRSTKRRNLK